MNIRIRQIYYSPETHLMCEDGFIPYYNAKASPFLENKVIYDLFKEEDHKEADMYGVFSWKFKSKLHFSSEYIFNRIEHVESEKQYDVYSFFGNTNLRNKQNMWLQGDTWHPLFSTIGKLLFWKLGLTDPTTFHCMHIYSNHWIAKRNIFEKFCNELLVPAIELMSTDSELIELLNTDSDYISKGKATPEACLPVFGKPFYTYHPFICERLFGTFCSMNNIIVKHL